MRSSPRGASAGDNARPKGPRRRWQTYAAWRAELHARRRAIAEIRLASTKTEVHRGERRSSPSGTRVDLSRRCCPEAFALSGSPPRSRHRRDALVATGRRADGDHQDPGSRRSRRWPRSRRCALRRVRVWLTPDTARRSRISQSKGFRHRGRRIGEHRQAVAGAAVVTPATRARRCLPSALDARPSRARDAISAITPGGQLGAISSGRRPGMLEPPRRRAGEVSNELAEAHDRAPRGGRGAPIAADRGQADRVQAVDSGRRRRDAGRVLRTRPRAGIERVRSTIRVPPRWRTP